VHAGIFDICTIICRDLAGPADPELARAAAPDSLRARFGQTEARNAVHVTDLAQDGRREAEFFFGDSRPEPIVETGAPLHA
jgi:nucleoside diphosphate kinase